MSTVHPHLHFPKKIPVLGVPFRVELVAGLEDEGEKVDGLTLVDKRIIRICADQDYRRRWTTLYHEFIHAVLGITGVSSVIPEEVEEIIAQSSEHANEMLMREVGSHYIGALNKNS